MAKQHETLLVSFIFQTALVRCGGVLAVQREAGSLHGFQACACTFLASWV